MATATTRILEGKQALRRRTRSEGRTNSHFTASPTESSPTNEFPSDEGFASGNMKDGEEEYSGTSSDEEDNQDVDKVIPRVRSPKQRRFSRSLLNDDMREENPRSETQKTRAWYEFDLIVVIALVSPIGNWLTGGDHVKIFLSFLLLIWYLHQIIEVPWKLYHKSRPKRRSPNVPLTSTAEDRYMHVASSELKRLEILYLSLSAISPLVGAFVLRVVTFKVLDKDAVSWFSTTLFVLATGMRPWSHIVERLNQRADDLHDVIHYPSPSVVEDQDLRQTIHHLCSRIQQLEDMVSRSETHFVHSTEEVYDYVDEALTVMEKAIRRHEKRYDQHEAKVRELEQTMVEKDHHKFSNSLDTISSLISACLPGGVKVQTRPRRPSYLHSPPSKHHSFRSYPSTSSGTLETIPEETPKYSLLFRPTALISAILSGMGYIATLPLRAVLHMIFPKY